MKKYLLLLLFFLLLLTSCAVTPPPDLSWYSEPAEGTSGIYFYQWKTGVLGCAWDVPFILDGKELGKINTGEYLYFEIPSGKHKYRFGGGLIPQHFEQEFEAGQNYFFRGFINMAQSTVILIRDKKAIEEAIKNIETGRYELGTKD